MTQPTPTAQPPMGTLRLTIQGNMLTANMFTPTVQVNGFRVPARYGPQDIPVYAGPNHLDVHAQWLRRYGQASLDTQVAPGQVLDVWYGPPAHQFSRGAIGFEKQNRPGMWFLWALVGVAALMVVMVVGLGLSGG